MSLRKPEVNKQIVHRTLCLSVFTLSHRERVYHHAVQSSCFQSENKNNSYLVHPNRLYVNIILFNYVFTIVPTPETAPSSFSPPEDKKFYSPSISDPLPSFSLGSVTTVAFTFSCSVSSISSLLLKSNPYYFHVAIASLSETSP